MIVGIAGSFGSGKGTVVAYLFEEKGFHHYSVSDFLKEEIARRSLPMNRDAMTMLANELRAQHGPHYLINTLYQRSLQEGGNAIIESLRNVAEVQRIKELGGIVIGVTADSDIRYKRAYARGSVKDNVSYQEFLEQEKRESNPNDQTKQDIFGALKESDFIINNDGTLEELHAKIDDVLERIKK